MKVILELTPEDSLLIQQAALLSQLSVNDFLLKTAYRAAKELTNSPEKTEQSVKKFPSLVTFRKNLPTCQMSAAELVSQMRDQDDRE